MAEAVSGLSPASVAGFVTLHRICAALGFHLECVHLELDCSC